MSDEYIKARIVQDTDIALSDIDCGSDPEEVIEWLCCELESLSEEIREESDD